MHPLARPLLVGTSESEHAHDRRASTDQAPANHAPTRVHALLSFLHAMHFHGDSRPRRWYNRVRLLVFVLALGVSALSVLVLYQPNMDAGTSVSRTLGITQAAWLVQLLLVIGALGSNWIFNAYCTYLVCLDVILYWATYQRQSWRDAVRDACLTLLKAIPVVLSTSQVVGLAAESNMSIPMIIAQILAYSFLHWFAVTQFVAGWLQSLYHWLLRCRMRYARASPAQWRAHQLHLELEQLRGMHLHTLDLTLHHWRQLWQQEQQQQQHRPEFSSRREAAEIEMVDEPPSDDLSLSSARHHAFLGELLSLNGAARDLSLAAPCALSHWTRFLLLDVLMALGLKCAYIGLDLAAWHHAGEACDGATQSSDAICGNHALLSTMTVLSLLPLNYLIMVVVGPANTRVLYRMVQSWRAGLAPPRVVQAYPRLVWAVRLSLFALTLLSFGTTVRLNDVYLPASVLPPANVNSILFNSYFNAFPIPAVALGAAWALLQMWSLVQGQLSRRTEGTILAHASSLTVQDATPDAESGSSLDTPFVSASSLSRDVLVEQYLNHYSWLVRRLPASLWLSYLHSLPESSLRLYFEPCAPSDFASAAAPEREHALHSPLECAPSPSPSPATWTAVLARWNPEGDEGHMAPKL